MNKIKQLTIRSRVLLGLLVLVSLLGISLGVKAYSDVQPVNVNNISGGSVTINQTGDQATSGVQPAQETTLSAVSSVDNLGNHLCVNGVCTYTTQATIRASTTAFIADPFLIATTTSGGGVAITDLVNGNGFTGNTSTIERMWAVTTSSTAPTTTWSIDCTSASNTGTTSTLAILKPESTVPANLAVSIESGITSSTSDGGIGSAVYASNGELAGTKPLITKIRLTPTHPYLVCKAYQPSGTSLDTLTNSANVGTIKIYAQISRPQF